MADAIVAEGLAKRYGQVKALAGLSLSVPEGTVLGLLGPAGAGKTTAMRILATLLRPDQGRAFVNGIDVTAEPEHARRHLGVSAQQPAVDGFLTGFEQLELVGRLHRLGHRRARARAEELLERFHLTEAGTRAVRTYSLAMRRRLDLAAALVAAPPVLLLDEPTLGLDPRGRLGMWDVIGERVRTGCTLLLCTAQLDEADQLADEIIVIDRGRAIAGGTPEELKRRIGGERIQVVLGNRAETQVVEDILNRVCGGQAAVLPDQHLVQAPVTGGAQALTELVRRLDAAGIEPVDIGIHRASLDDMFLKLTGQAATPTVAEEEART
ncbi:daunorubicin resistance protein DrrA family ABC transporter ATP-binding protein [Catellatospora sp. TT07R-123]|uniref:ATP-binding cassette domain-containing protein n=1 Tax=Catellatospora sp. TT07R-123 TaxID=2733863 RepID=UPI001B2CD59B|nr:ATP-binding cassette domain-containing protein [Catellatospora sp. TT07R-123]GHJ50010.1 daunorubicin resistance protein DrrA family ABC transporter ATP-binding protein [Catellatospora sp. TT07R-123]